MVELDLGNETERGQSLFKGMEKNKKAKGDKKKKGPPIRVSEHGRYQIKSGLLAGKYVARAFVKPPTNARGLIAEASGASEEAAINSLHEVLAARESHRIETRRKDSHTDFSVPSIEEYSEALAHVALTRPQRAMLTALSLANADGLTDVQLANTAGYKSLASAQRSLANAGRLFSDYLNFEISPKAKSGELEGISFLAFRADPNDQADRGAWIVYPELHDALRATF